MMKNQVDYKTLGQKIRIFWDDRGFYQKIALIIFIPLTLVILGVIILGYFLGQQQGDFKEELEHNKKKTDEQIKDKIEEAKDAAEKEKELEEEHTKVLEEIKDNEKKIEDILARIDDAIDRCDLDELERLRRELNST